MLNLAFSLLFVDICLHFLTKKPEETWWVFIIDGLGLGLGRLKIQWTGGAAFICNKTGVDWVLL